MQQQKYKVKYTVATYKEEKWKHRRSFKSPFLKFLLWWYNLCEIAKMLLILIKIHVLNVIDIWLNARQLIWKQRSTLSCRLGRGNQLLDLCWSKGRIKHSHNVTWFLLLKSRGTGCYGNYSIDQNIKAGCKGAFENPAISLHPLKTAFIHMWQRKAFLICGHFKGHDWKIEPLKCSYEFGNDRFNLFTQSGPLCDHVYSSLLRRYIDALLAG